MAGVFDWLPPGVASQVPNRPTFDAMAPYYGPPPNFAPPGGVGMVPTGYQFTSAMDPVTSNGAGDSGYRLGHAAVVGTPAPPGYQPPQGYDKMPEQTPYMPGLGQYTRDPATAFHKRQNEFPNLPQQPGVGGGGTHAPVINDVGATQIGTWGGGQQAGGPFGQVWQTANQGGLGWHTSGLTPQQSPSWKPADPDTSVYTRRY